MDEDEQLAMLLQEQYYSELHDGKIEVNDEIQTFLPSNTQLQDAFRNSPAKKSNKREAELSIVAPEWEDLDPTPDLHAMFIQYNKQFFWGKLSGCEVKWSPRMTLCAGVCSYQGRGGLCSIRLSVPLLKLRPRKDFVETLLHEMIHAYLFVTDGNDDHDGHGPAFHEHMYRINKATGTKISVYHNFHDEVNLYQQHWWKCDGPCQNRRPFYGMVKRSMNRAPGPNDRWWKDHQSSCNGTFNKIKEPENYGKKKTAQKRKQNELPKGQKDIRSFVGDKGPSSSKVKNGDKGGKEETQKIGNGGMRGNVFGFGGTSFAPPSGTSGLKTKGKSGAFVVNPGWKTKDNSSSGSVIKKGSENQENSSISGGMMTSPLENSVRERVRNIWANKFSSDNIKTDSSSINSLTCDNKKAKTDCPSNVVDSFKGKVESSSQGQDHKEKCPVCEKMVSTEIINSHVNQCLNEQQFESPSQSSSQKIRSNPKNPFLDDDEEDSDIEEIPAANNNSSNHSSSSIKYPCPVCQREVYSDDMNTHLDNCVT